MRAEKVSALEPVLGTSRRLRRSAVPEPALVRAVDPEAEKRYAAAAERLRDCEQLRRLPLTCNNESKHILHELTGNLLKN